MNNRKRNGLRGTGLAALLVGVGFALVFPVSQAESAGFYIQEQSVSALGAAFAGAAAMPRDASTVYFNPAGMIDLQGAHINVGGNLIYGMTDLDDTGSTLFGAPVGGGGGGNPLGAVGVPNLFFTQQVTDRFWLGIGVTFPFGLGGEYDGDWFGRFDSIKSDLKTVDVQPSAAVRINDWLALGGGISIQYAEAELTNAITDGVEGLSTLVGDDISLGFTASVLLRPTDETAVGITYRSAIYHDVEGRAKVEGTAGSDFDIPVSARLGLPDIASFGVAHELDEKWTLLGQANWFGWNNFQSIAVKNAANVVFSEVVQNYQTTWSFAVGAEYEWSDDWTLRAGYQFDESPTTDEFRTSRTPDGDRNWYSVGATYKADENLSFDFAATWIDIRDEEIDVTRNGGLARMRADIDASVGILALGLNYKF